MPFSKKPAFDDLPLDKTGPPGNAWGLFGPDDQCGMLNLLTPDRTRAAASEIRDGVRISTDWPLDRITTPAFNRIPFAQTISNIAPTSVNDDILHFNTQSSSQWDGLRHFGYQEQRLYFNGRTLDDILTTKINGIHSAYFYPKTRNRWRVCSNRSCSMGGNRWHHRTGSLVRLCRLGRGQPCPCEAFHKPVHHSH